MADQKEGNVGMTKEQKFLTFIPLAGLIIYLVVHALAPTAPQPATFPIHYFTVGGATGDICQSTPIQPSVHGGDYIIFYAADNYPSTFTYTITFPLGKYPFTGPQEPIVIRPGQSMGPYTANPVSVTTTFHYTLSSNSSCNAASPDIGIIINH